MKFFDYPAGIRMINSNFISLFGRPARISENENVEKLYVNLTKQLAKF